MALNLLAEVVIGQVYDYDLTNNIRDFRSNGSISRYTIRGREIVRSAKSYAGNINSTLIASSLVIRGILSSVQSHLGTFL